MIKSNPIGAFLGGIFLVVALGTSALAFTYVKSLQRYTAAQLDVEHVSLNQARLQNLISEAAAYAQREPAMIPILESMGLKVRPPASSPTGKAPAK